MILMGFGSSGSCVQKGQQIPLTRQGEVFPCLPLPGAPGCLCLSASAQEGSALRTAAQKLLLALQGRVHLFLFSMARHVPRVSLSTCLHACLSF